MKEFTISESRADRAGRASGSLLLTTEPALLELKINFEKKVETGVAEVNRNYTKKKTTVGITTYEGQKLEAD